MVLHDLYGKVKKMRAKKSNIYENGALGSRCSDGGDRNPGRGVILPEARGGAMGQYIDRYIYICGERERKREREIWWPQFARPLVSRRVKSCLLGSRAVQWTWAEVPASPWAFGPPLLATTWERCIHYTIYNHTTTTITMATNPFTISPLPRGTVPLRMGGMRWQALQFIILKTHLYIYIYVYIYIYIYI